MRHLILALALACLAACATTQGKYRPLGRDSYPGKPTSAAVEIFDGAAPSRPFERIARLDAHFEKTGFKSTSRETGLAELKTQARAAGADAIIEIEEKRSRVGETMILHVTGIGIHYVAQ